MTFLTESFDRHILLQKPGFGIGGPGAGWGNCFIEVRKAVSRRENKRPSGWPTIDFFLDRNC